MTYNRHSSPSAASKQTSNIDTDLTNAVKELFPGITKIEINRYICKIEMDNVKKECTTIFENLNKILNTYIEKNKVKKDISESQKLLQDLYIIKQQLEECSGGPLVYGEYNCSNKTITIYLPCFYIEPCTDKSYIKSKLLRTLAHEVIHYLQYGGSSTPHISIPVEVKLQCDNNINNLIKSIPYKYRPHEVEAREKEDLLASYIENNRHNKILDLLDKLASEVSK